MSSTRIALIIVLVVGIAAVIAMATRGNEAVENDGRVAGVATQESQSAPENNVRTNTEDVDPAASDPEQTQDVPPATTPDDRGGTLSVFRIVYLANFTGASDPPVQNTFSLKEYIVLVVRLRDGVETDAQMTTNIYAGDKMIKSYPPIEILNGEIGLANPGKRGSYVVRVEVDGTTVQELPFRIQ